MLSRLEESFLERKVAEVLEAGFVKPPPVVEKSTFDFTDCQAAAKDIVDMILGGYHMDPKEDDRLSVAAEALKKSLSEPKTGLSAVFMSPRDAAGFGGGMGEE